MNILFIIPSYKPAYIYGGTVVVVAMLAESLVKLGHKVTVLTTTANGTEELPVEAGKEILVEGVSVYYFKRNTGDHTHVSFDLWRFLKKEIRNYDKVHIHSWWNALVIGATWICKRKDIHPVLSPHGMFSNYILGTNNSRKKKWIHQSVGKLLLANTVLHVSTDMEWKESRNIIKDWKGAIIPNLVALSDAVYKKPNNEVFTIGFLSRIDPKKGLDILITALSQVSFPYKLLIAGSGEPDYEQALKDLSVQLGNSQHIAWVGWKKGEDKFAFLSQLDLFALISHSENFAIVVIEALSVGTPVLVSNQVGLYNYVLRNELGWVTITNTEQVQKDLETIYQNRTKLATIQSISAAAIQKDFDTCHLTQQYIELYTAKYF